MSSPLPIIGYTLGDQAGIGPELIEQVLKDLPKHLACYQLIGERIEVQLGQATKQSSQAAWDHLELAAEALRDGRIDALVTGPICKKGLHDLGFPFAGQTEFFAARLNIANFAMCLTGEHLTVALASTHIALRDVATSLNCAELVRVSRLLADFLRKMAKGKNPTCPHIALAGLNPHNGEQGAFGDEESRIISPAVALLQEANDTSSPTARYSGPCVPDTVYRDAAMGLYDGIVAPYHDQALIPLKLLDFDSAVNVTLGLPRLRMSPDHGTAFSIAGKGIAKPDSMRAAFQLALQTLS